MTRMSYQADLTDGQWITIAHVVPKPQLGGRLAKYQRLPEASNRLRALTHHETHGSLLVLFGHQSVLISNLYTTPCFTQTRNQTLSMPKNLGSGPSQYT
jgi:hypothetical protein